MSIMSDAFNIATFDLGRSFEPDEDMFILGHIKKRDYSAEKLLFGTKWFDYRFLSPIQATRAFVDEYAVAAHDVYASTFDAVRADHMTYPTSNWLFGKIKLDPKPETKRLLAGYWKARQVADALGMPYELFARLALQQRLRFWQRTYLPKVYHIYEREFVEKVAERWQDIQREVTHVATHPAYHEDNYRGLKVQNQYHDFLMANPSPTSLAFHVRERRLPAPKAWAMLSGTSALDVFEQFLM